MAIRATSRAKQRWTVILEACHGCVRTAAARERRAQRYVQQWYAIIYGREKRCGANSTLNQDQVDELTAAIHARIRQADMAHRFGVTVRTLRNMIKRYDLPMLRAPRGPKQDAPGG